MSSTLVMVQSLAVAGDVLISQHAHDRFSESAISTDEVQRGSNAAIMSEEFPDYNNGPSVLVLQADASGQPIHVLWGLRKGTTAPAVVVTAYRPDPQLWSADFRSRR